METLINEIFSSIQGEGPVVGYKQLFIRFCKCNLKCDYCDTEYKQGKTYTPEGLYKYINGNFDLKTFHSVSLTGGEPLLETEFLKEFLPLVKSEIKIYLETNATLFKELEHIKDNIDIISADIKLPSSTKVCAKDINLFDIHKKFFEKAQGIETFAKVVFDKNITEDEISKCIELAKIDNIELILQPKMSDNTMSVDSDFSNKILDKFISCYKKTRLIPQVHKFLKVR